MRLAVAQIDVVHGNASANIAEVAARLAEFATEKVDLAVFPECALTGYGAADLADAQRIALEPDHLEAVADAVIQTGVAAIVGYLLNEGDAVFNVATLFMPDGTRHEYRKTHLPFMGADRFCTAGSQLAPLDTPWGRIGVVICYDLRFPEATRSLALAGAELVIVPTNWPEGAIVSAEHIAIARAAENRIFVATCNRVGQEGDFRFIGKSKIIGIDGHVLAAAEGTATSLITDLDLTEAREKRRVVIPGEYETDVFARRTDLYFR